MYVKKMSWLSADFRHAYTSWKFICIYILRDLPLAFVLDTEQNGYAFIWYILSVLNLISPPTLVFNLSRYIIATSF